jgi:hypothetical protein
MNRVGQIFVTGPRNGLLLLLLSVSQPAEGQQNQPSPEEQKAADLRMPELDRSALEPEMREPVEVAEGERNPFGLVGAPDGVEGPARPLVETEEQKLRRILGSMRVSGLSGSPGNYRVLLGSLLVREGEALPRLFADQAEVLRVAVITEREVTLAFVEEQTNKPARTIGLGMDLKPQVRSMLAGEVFRKLVPFKPTGEANVPPISSEAVQFYLNAAERNGLQSLVDRDVEFMGDASAKPPEKKAPDEKSPGQ